MQTGHAQRYFRSIIIACVVLTAVLIGALVAYGPDHVSFRFLVPLPLLLHAILLTIGLAAITDDPTVRRWYWLGPYAVFATAIVGDLHYLFAAYAIFGVIVSTCLAFPHRDEPTTPAQDKARQHLDELGRRLFLGRFPGRRKPSINESRIAVVTLTLSTALLAWVFYPYVVDWGWDSESTWGKLRHFVVIPVAGYYLFHVAREISRHIRRLSKSDHADSATE